MHKLRFTNKTFLAIQAIVLLAATLWFDRSGVFRGIAAAQACLLGVWIGVGQMHSVTRRITAVAVGLAFLLVIATAAFGFPVSKLFGLGRYEYQLLLLTVRTIIVGSVFWQALGRHGFNLTSAGEPRRDPLLRFGVRHLFVLMTLVALFFVVTRNLEGGAFYKILLVAYVVLFGLAYAGISLLTSLMVLEPKLSPVRCLAYVTAIFALIAAVVAHTLQQTDNWWSAQYALNEILVEIAWLAGSLVVLRFTGMRLAKPSPSDVAAGATPRLSQPRTSWPRFSLKALFILFTFAAIWLGWNVSTVHERKRLRALIAAQPTDGRPMVIVTFAEGSARAPKAVKERIAPHVTEAFQIRNRGGRTIGPRTGGNLSLLRRWLGDELVFIILVDEEANLLDEVEAAFPEARIVVREPLTNETGPQP